MKDKVNLAAKLAAFDEYFSPKIIGELNDYKLELVKAKGEFVWHSHPNTDDFFLVLAGRLTIPLRDRDIEPGPGELLVRCRLPLRQRVRKSFVGRPNTHGATGSEPPVPGNPPCGALPRASNATAARPPS
jgi:hypothetical protein